MAKITKVKISVGRTINTGDFSSLRADYGVEAEVGEEDLSHVTEQLTEEALEGLDFVVKELRGAR